MDNVVAGQEWVSDSTWDLHLLTIAMIEAEQARMANKVIGPPLEEAAVRLAYQEATRRDFARLDARFGRRQCSVDQDPTDLGVAS